MIPPTHKADGVKCAVRRDFFELPPSYSKRTLDEAMLAHRGKAARSASVASQPQDDLSGLDEASLRELREAGLLTELEGSPGHARP